MLATCFGGITVASKTCSRWLAASQSHTSFSSGVRPTPWLGQPCRLIGPFLNPLTSTRCSTLPVLMSPISNPSRSLTQQNASVCAALTVNGRMDAANGPTWRTDLLVEVSTTWSNGDLSPARYANFPSRPTTVLCAPLFGVIVASTAPLAPSTTFQCGPSKLGR